MAAGLRRETRFTFAPCGGVVLRITVDRSGAIVRLQLEGRLTGAWVQELEHSWRSLLPEQRAGALVDLAGITFIGADGSLVLIQLWKEGAVFHAPDCLTRSIVESITGINLPCEG